MYFRLMVIAPSGAIIEPGGAGMKLEYCDIILDIIGGGGGHGGAGAGSAGAGGGGGGGGATAAVSTVFFITFPMY